MIKCPLVTVFSRFIDEWIKRELFNSSIVPSFYVENKQSLEGVGASFSSSSTLAPSTSSSSSSGTITNNTPATTVAVPAALDPRRRPSAIPAPPASSSQFSQAALEAPALSSSFFSPSSSFTVNMSNPAVGPAAAAPSSAFSAGLDEISAAAHILKVNGGGVEKNGRKLVVDKRKGIKLCAMREGCILGEKCRFSHLDPTSIGGFGNTFSVQRGKAKRNAVTPRVVANGCRQEFLFERVSSSERPSTFDLLTSLSSSSSSSSSLSATATNSALLTQTYPIKRKLNQQNDNVFTRKDYFVPNTFEINADITWVQAFDFSKLESKKLKLY